jgi:hypothetical protein
MRVLLAVPAAAPFPGLAIRRHNAALGVLTDYFSAPSDEVAATAAGIIGGPGVEAGGPSALPPFDTVQFKGIDPVVNLGRLESILTGVDYHDIADPDHGRLVAQRDGDGPTAQKATEDLSGILEQGTVANLTWRLLKQLPKVVLEA